MKDWISIKNETSRAEFCRRCPHPFFLSVTDATSDEFEFATAVVDLRDEGTVEDDPEVFPIKKTGANPFRDRVLVGRTRNCDVVLGQASVSKLHAEIRFESPDTATVTDKDSRNGTEVNGKRLAAHQPTPLASGDRVRFGGTTMIFLSPGELYDIL